METPRPEEQENSPLQPHRPRVAVSEPGTVGLAILARDAEDQLPDPEAQRRAVLAQHGIDPDRLTLRR